MNNQVNGIHHVTAIAGDPVKNLSFYAGVLGLRFVKKTVNFDDPFTYHFYFGDATGRPGTLMTFFPWTSEARRGSPGSGQITGFTFSVPPGSIPFWSDRLRRSGIRDVSEESLFGEKTLTASDPDGFRVTLTGARNDSRSFAGTQDDIPPEYAIRGMHSVTLTESDPRATVEFLTGPLGFRLLGEEQRRLRFLAGNSETDTFVDVVPAPQLPRGTMGVGITHHVAFRTPDDATQRKIRSFLETSGRSVTPIIDRTYFRSIYFNEPGGVICEIATDGPGFLIDETPGNLGTSLKLPPQFESYRKDIEEVLPPVTAPRAVHR